MEYMDDGTLVMPYADYNDGSWSYIYATRSSNDGVSRGTRVRVNSTVSGDSRPKGHMVKAGTRLHAVWMTNANSKHSYSDDGGLTWTSNESLDWDGDSTNPWLVAAPNGVVVLSWLDGVINQYNDIFYREFSGDWSPTRRVNNQLHTRCIPTPPTRSMRSLSMWAMPRWIRGTRTSSLRSACRRAWSPRCEFHESSPLPAISPAAGI
jgi:hypothetical protein